MSQNRLFLIAVFIVVGSSNPVAIKFAMNAGWTPFALGMLRMAVIGLFFTVWVRVRGETLAGDGRAARRYIMIAAACKAVGVVFFYVALSVIPANRGVILSTLSPLASLLLVHLVLESERVMRRHVFGVLTSLAGIVILLMIRNGGETSLPHKLQFMGDAAMIVSVFFNSAMVVFEKKALLNNATPGQILVTTNLLSIAVFTLLFAFSAESLHVIPVTTASIGAYLYLVSVVGIFLFYYRRWLVSELEVTYINSFSHLGKAVSIIYAVLLLGERISMASIACFALVIAGTVIAARENAAESAE